MLQLGVTSFATIDAAYRRIAAYRDSHKPGHVMSPTGSLRLALDDLLRRLPDPVAELGSEQDEGGWRHELIAGRDGRNTFAVRADTDRLVPWSVRRALQGWPALSPSAALFRACRTEVADQIEAWRAVELGRDVPPLCHLTGQPITNPDDLAADHWRPLAMLARRWAATYCPGGALVADRGTVIIPDPRLADPMQAALWRVFHDGVIAGGGVKPSHRTVNLRRGYQPSTRHDMRPALVVVDGHSAEVVPHPSEVKLRAA